jgi:selenocysteine lyase/cysteine desulfurase
MIKLSLLVLFTFTLVLWAKDPPAFGKETKKQLFMINMNETFLNHGSYGATPRQVFEKQVEWIKIMESSPRNFITHVYPAARKVVLQKLAKYIGADENDVVLIENASSAVNSVLRSQKWNRGDKILFLLIEYGMVKNVIDYLVDQHGLVKVMIDVSLPISTEKLILSIRDVINAQKIRFAVFDHISSVPSMILPIKEIIQLMKSRKIPTLIDGAHVVGQVPLNLTDLDPDYYFSNGHKWLPSSKGSAFLYVRRELQNTLIPTVISSYKGGFQQDFTYTGTRDYTNYLSIGEALAFREWITEEKLTNYNNGLCKSVSDYLVKRWQTDVPVPISMLASTGNVRIPCNGAPQCYSWNIGNLTDRLREYGYTVVLYEYQNIRYIRLECQIYNYIEEWMKFANMFDRLIAD